LPLIGDNDKAIHQPMQRAANTLNSIKPDLGRMAAIRMEGLVMNLFCS